MPSLDSNGNARGGREREKTGAGAGVGMSAMVESTCDWSNKHCYRDAS